jgi:cell division protein ZipA
MTMGAVLGMMSELRWTLLILGVLFVAALAWWERRRPRQASGSLERAPPRESSGATPPRSSREPGLTLPEIRAREPLVPREPLVARTLPVVDFTPPPQVPELGPAHEAAAGAAGEAAPGVATHARRAAGDDSSEDDTIEEEVIWDESIAQDAVGDDGEAPPAPVASAGVPALPRERLPELPAAPPPQVQWPPDSERRILALRLVAAQEERFAGRSLRQALAAEGFVLGQFAIFHKGDEERRAVLSAASLTRPGTFDMDTMDSQHYGGLSLFAVLPGPKPPPQTFEELVFTARNLNERLHGVLQDEQGSPLTAARIAVLREQLRGAAAS